MFGFQPVPDDSGGDTVIPPPHCSMLTSKTTATDGDLHTVSLPTGVSAGDIILIVVSTRDASGAPYFPGYTINSSEIFNGDALNGTIQTFTRIADGTEGSTVTGSTMFPIKMVSIAHHISCAYSPSVSKNTGSSSIPSGSSPSPAKFVSVLQMFAVGWRDGSISASAFPSGYTTYYAAGASGSGSNDAGLAVGWAAVYGGSEAPGAATLSASTKWATITHAY